jgi:transcriptional regulator with XRE-family HTH domain
MILPMTSPTFGQTLRARREKLGLTRRALEDQSGVSVRQIEYLEKDQKEPKRDTLDALARVLGPEIIQAAFPDLVLLRSRRRAIPGYGDLADEAMLDTPAAGQSLAVAMR